MTVLIKILQFLLSLSILVVIHELGHFVMAKLFKTRVEKYYLFFDACFSLFKFRKGETEYGIGWIPLGGYVKISGMIDESMDKEQMKQPPQPYEFRSKPSWQRLLIMVGGVIFNFILAIIIYWCIMLTWGESYIKNSDVDTGVYVSELGREIGFQDGDRILSFEGKEVDRFEDLQIEHFYDVPDFKQADFLIRMKGNSMYPKYSSGDIIACAVIKETLFPQ